MVRRCLICGRRWIGSAPPCGHPQEQNATSLSAAGEAEPLRLEVLPGYRLGEELGRGGFGIVLAAVRERDDLNVAIKVFHRSSPLAQERLRLEANALRTVGPPFVPVLYDTGILPDGSPYLVCERVHLPPLSRRLAEWGGPLEHGTFVALADSVLATLEATHAQGFIHLDLKPENIFISESPPAALLIDFGIAERAKPGSATVTRSSTGVAFGTPDYMAPEQCERQSVLDHRADIYAAGVVLYEMLTGRTPFFGSPAEVREAHVGRRPPPPSRVAHVPATFDALLLRCLAKEPSRRWSSVGELRRALQRTSTRGSADVAATDCPPRAPAAEPARPTASPRVAVGLLFLETAATTGRIQQALTSLGGQILSVSGSRCVAVFGSEASGNPVQRAYHSALALLGQALVERALVDRDRVRVRRRPDGSQRLFSTAFLQKDRFPRATDPRGVLLSQEAAHALPELRTALVRDQVLRLMPREPREDDSSSDDSEATLFQLGAGHLIGRQEQFQILFDSARRAAADRLPTIATVTCEPGYGKSHLCAAVLSRLRTAVPDVEVVHLRAREPLGGESQESLRTLLRATLRLPMEAPPDHGRALLLAGLGSDMGEEVWPAAALVLGWIDADAPAVRRLSAAPAALRSAATRAAGEALRRMAAEHPVCCTIDDAHFADDTTLDALEYATLAESGLPLWVCVLARPSFEKARPSWAQRAARSLSVRLPPLDADSARELCRMLLRPAENVSRATLARIVQQTQGNPLLLVELARGIKRHGLIRRHGRGDAWYLATDELDVLPDLPRVEWLAERELAALPPELATHARLIAHLGAELTIAELEGVLGELELLGNGDIFPLDARVGVQRLLDHGLLVAHRDGGYGFRHQIIREQVAGSTSEEMCRCIHEACFRYYQQAQGMPDQHRLPRLAQHAAASGACEVASRLYLDLADLASRRHTYVDAESMYSRALAFLPAGDRARRMRAFSGRGSMRYRLSRFDDALEDLRRARAIAHELGDVDAEIDLLLDMATVLDWSQDAHTSKELVEEAQVLLAAQAVRSPRLEARMCMGHGRVALRQQQWTTAQPLLEQAIASAEQLGDEGYETLVIGFLLLGVVATAEKQSDLAETSFTRAIDLCEEHGDRLHLAVALTNRHVLWLSRKDQSRAASDALRGQQIGREIGQAEVEYASAYNLAAIYYYAGDLEAAWPHMRRAVEIEPNNAAKPLSLLLHARLLALADRRAAARRVLDSIRENQAASRAADNDDALFTEPEEVLYTMADLATRAATAGEWDALRARAERLSQPEELAEVLEMMGLWALRRGRVEQARGLLEDALAVCARTPHLIEERIRQQLDSLG